MKNLGQNAVEAIRKAREESGRFRSLYEFCEKVDLSAAEPAHDREPDPRRAPWIRWKARAAQLFAAVEGAMEAGQRAWRDREQRPGRPVRRADRRSTSTTRSAAAQRAGLDPRREARRARKSCWAST